MNSVHIYGHIHGGTYCEPALHQPQTTSLQTTCRVSGASFILDSLPLCPVTDSQHRAPNLAKVLFALCASKVLFCLPSLRGNILFAGGISVRSSCSSQLAIFACPARKARCEERKEQIWRVSTQTCQAIRPSVNSPTVLHQGRRNPGRSSQASLAVAAVRSAASGAPTPASRGTGKCCIWQTDRS